MNLFLSHIHKAIREARITRKGATIAPEKATRFSHKEYLRMERITLPSPEIDIGLFDALTHRRSARRGDIITPLSLRELGTLFGAALGRHGDLRNYPSGGALYPIETYIIVEALEGQKSGVYHYHPTEHALEYLWPLPEAQYLNDYVRPADFPLSALIVFTSVWSRSSAKYGDLAYSHAMLEAGHMSQNILLVCTGLDLATRPMAGFSDELVARALDLDTDAEQVIHTITLAKKVTHREAGPDKIVASEDE